jgi:hypothetical protein
MANPRVGERINADGRIGAAVFPTNLDIKAKPKAKVFQSLVDRDLKYLFLQLHLTE